MVLGAFSLQHNAIASINDNDITDHKLILSILYEQCCKAFICKYELSTEKTQLILIIQGLIFQNSPSSLKAVIPI